MNRLFIQFITLNFLILGSGIFPLYVFSQEKKSEATNFLNSLGPHWSRENEPKPLFKPSPPPVQAKAYLLIDAHSGKVLAARNIHEKLAPASLTKMMTAYLVCSAVQTGRLQLEDRATISQKAGTTGGSRMFVASGTQVKIQDLIQGVIVQSGNDASIALAEHLAGNESYFANIMNDQAQNLGMKDTHFVNVSGLPHTDHYTTALDMATLARAIIFDFPQFYPWYSQKSFTYSGVKQTNRNRLLFRNIGVDGIKTGDTGQAGYCLVASAVQKEMRLIVVIMGSPSEALRFQGAQALLNYGFRYFETHKIHSAREAIIKEKVWFGSKSRVGIGVENDLYVTVIQGEAKRLQTLTKIQDRLKAPLEKNREIGITQVLLNNEIIASMPLITFEAVNKGAWWRRLWDHLMFFCFRKWH